MMETEETTQNAPVVPAYPYSSLLRITHWLNVPLLLLMMASGFQIWWAYPAFGPDRPNPEAIYESLRGTETRADPRAINLGADYRVFLQSLTKTFGIGGWLAGALRWHFALMWPYTINGLIFLLLLLLTEEGRHYRIRRADFSGVKEMLLHPIKTFHHPPGEGKFNPIQKLAYNTVILAGVMSVLTGLAILKPVQFKWLTWLFGGYQPSRFLHFLVMLFLVIFMIGHFLMVISHGWRRGLAPMIVGDQGGTGSLSGQTKAIRQKARPRRRGGGDSAGFLLARKPHRGYHERSVRRRSAGGLVRRLWLPLRPGRPHARRAHRRFFA